MEVKKKRHFKKKKRTEKKLFFKSHALLNAPSVLQDRPVTKLILLFRLNGVGPLSSQLPHRTLHVHRPEVAELVHAVVDGAERATATNARTAVDQHGGPVRGHAAACGDRLGQLGLRVAHIVHQAQNVGTAPGNAVIGPRQELEVNEGSLFSLWAGVDDISRCSVPCPAPGYLPVHKNIYFCIGQHEILIQ